jgi:hypothetical protein
MYWKKNKWKVIVPVLIVAVLAGAFYFGGNAPGARGWSVASTTTPEPPGEVTANTTGIPEALQELAGMSNPSPTATPVPSGTEDPTEDPKQTTEPAGEPEATGTPEPEPTPSPTMEINSETGKDKYLTDPVPSGQPLPVEPQDIVIGSTAYACTLSISCVTILDNMDLCDPEKAELVPEDGWILESTVVTFYEGESVFNVLQRACKQLEIQMEFENTPIYNSAYIEGIHNLYEYDVGELSGWMYKVNDWFPNYGCSRYQLKDGDVINWVYTCDLGYDVGGGYAVGG